MNFCFISYMNCCKFNGGRWSRFGCSNRCFSYEFTDGSSCFDDGYSWGAFFNLSFTSVQFKVERQ